MNHDGLVLCSDAWLARLLSKNLMTGTAMLLAYGIVASFIVATLAHTLVPAP
jgi:hypothetical protein